MFGFLCDLVIDCIGEVLSQSISLRTQLAFYASFVIGMCLLITH